MANNYNGSVELQGGLCPRNGNNFPLMEAHDILVDIYDKRLDDLVSDLLSRIIALESGVTPTPPPVTNIELTSDGKGNVTVTGATLSVDSNGNATITANSGTLNLVDNGGGNITMEVV